MTLANEDFRRYSRFKVNLYRKLLPMSTPEQAKALLSEVVSRGARKRIAQHLGIAESDLSRRFSPNDERKSGIGEALREAGAIASQDPAAFPKVKAFVQGSLDALDPEKDTELPLPQLVVSFQREALQAAQAFILDRPVDEQVREASEAVDALQQFIASHLSRKSNQVSIPSKPRRLSRAG